MVSQEFEAIWTQVQAELKREGATPEDEGKSEDELKAEYRGIAERRVRLGLVLAKIGEQNAITIGQDEVNRALAARARQFPGQEKQVIQYYTSNPQAMAELRVPLFEDKVIDFLSELIEVQDRKVDRDILFLDPDDAEEKLKAAEATVAEAAPAEAKAKKGQSQTRRRAEEPREAQEGQGRARRKAEGESQDRGRREAKGEKEKGRIGPPAAVDKCQLTFYTLDDQELPPSWLEAPLRG